MKLRYLFSIVLSSVFLFSACEEQLADSWDNIKLSSTYLSIAEEGGEATLTINATEDWAFVEDDVWPNVIKRDKDKNITESTPSWLVADKLSGTAGETVVKFSAEAAANGRELELKIQCGKSTQYIRVRQGSMTITKATVKEVIAGPEGKLYEVTGVCTSISNTTYGNWYLKDDSSDSQIYVYGTVNSSGQYDWASFNIEQGDIVTVQGAYVLYNGTTPEFVDATFIKVQKSLAKVETETATVPKEGAELEVKVSYKGDGLFPSVPEEFRSWISIVDTKMIKGQPTKIEPNPADTAVVKIQVMPNEGGNREGSVTFVSSTSSVSYSFMQEGAIAAVSVADFLAAPEGTALYELTGIVKNLANTTYGNFDLVDATGSVYVYGLTNNGAIGSNDKKFAEIGINEGDVITIIGTRTSYKETPQVGGTAYLKEHVVAAKEATVTEFLAESKGTWCKVTGTIANLVNETYGNFDLVGEDGASVYVYGLTTSYVAKNDKSFANLGLKEGDIVTLVGKRDSYNDQDQVGGPAYYISHVEGAPAADPWEAEGVATYVLDEFMYTDYPQYCALTELKAYADETNVYARLKTTKTSGVGMLRLCTADTGEGSESVWYWEKTTYATPVYKSSKAKVDENFNFELSYNGAAVGLETKIEGEDVYWIMTIPRSAHDHAKNAGTMHLGFVSYTAAEAENGFMPKVWGDMLKVTLP